MKKILCMMMVLLALTTQAQIIQNNSKWWDGSILYTAKVQGNSVKMEGIGEHEGGFFFNLTKVEGKSGEYILTGEEYEAEALRAKVGWRVQYVRQDGMYFLAIRNPKGDAVWQMTLTPDDLESNLSFERYLEQQPVGEQLSNCLLNTTYLGRFSKDQLRLMRNEILARHGWRFQSKDLQDYFGSQSWYKPGNNNGAIKLHIIEQLNIQLIKSEETVPDENRISAETSYTVTNENEFLAALGSNRTIIIGENVHLNLSRVLENESLFTHVKGRRWSSDAQQFIGQGPLVISESETDGRQLALVNFKELVIKGAGHSSIEVDPRYSFCLYFINCEHCEVHNLTIGHTEGGYCSGGVIGVKAGRQNMVKDCDLYGCGTYGFSLMDTQDFSAIKCLVHDCSYGIMELFRSTAIRFNTCDFFNNKEYTLVESHACQGLSFTDCRFYANWADAPLFSFDTEVYMSSCEIYHPTENLGSTNMIEMRDMKFSPNPLDRNVGNRKIGPDVGN